MSVVFEKEIETTIDDEEEFYETEESACSETDDQNANVDEEDNEGETSLQYISLPNHIRCSTHTLNLCASADLRRTLVSHAKLANFHKTVMEKCNILWKSAQRPNSFEKMEKILGHSLSRPVKTRWNSLFDSLSQIYKIKDKMAMLTK